MTTLHSVSGVDDHFTIWLSGKDFQTDFILDVMYVTCTVFGWRLFIKVKAECIDRPQGQVMRCHDAT